MRTIRVSHSEASRIVREGLGYKFLPHAKNPTPPKGYVFFKWKTKKGKSGMSEQLCPRCETFGSLWYGGGFQDPKVEKAIKKAEKSGKGDYDALCVKVDGDYAKCHWSRYGLGKCCQCGLKFWHTFGGQGLSGDWRYYHEPFTKRKTG